MPAQWVIAIFVRKWGRDAAGLATLTHTPSPMGFLNEILGRPSCRRCTGSGDRAEADQGDNIVDLAANVAESASIDRTQ